MQHKVSSQHRQTKPVRTKRQSRNEGVLGLILSLTLLSPVAAQTTTIGLHGFSYHDRGHFNNENYGLYLEHKGYTGGFYKNSLNKDSAYLGYSLHWALPENPVVHSVSLLGGVVSGYRTRSYPHDYSPMGAFSMKHDFTAQQGVRLSVLPTHRKSPANYVLHLSYEVKL
jgi:hypothetical protein